MPWWETTCWPLSRVLQRMSELGLKRVELAPPHVAPNMSSKSLHTVKSVLRSYQVEPACLESFSFLRSVRNSDVKELSKVIHLALRLETEIVRVFSGPVKAGSRRRAIELLKKSAKQAEDCGVKLAVENIWYHHFGTVQKMKMGLDDIGSDNTGALVDLANFHVGGDDPVNAVKILKDHLFHVHAKDALREGKNRCWAIMGKGDLSKKGLYPKIISELRRAGYQGCISIEPHVFPALGALEASVGVLQPLVIEHRTKRHN